MQQPSLPPLRQIPSPNFSDRVPNVIDMIVIHDCEGSYAGSINVFLAQRGKQSVSAHLVLNDDGTECTQMVPFAKKAWHACNENSRSIGVEMSGFKAKGFTTAELAADASIVAWLLHKYQIPCQDALGGKRPGFTSHAALGANGGGHSDPTTDPAEWEGYVERVVAAYGAWASAPLPEWGLHGFAPPAPFVSPPPVPLGFLASGTVRSDDNPLNLPKWPPPGNDFFKHAGRAMNRWLSLSVSDIVAYGFLGNHEGECAFNVMAVGDKGRAYGLGQWWAPRIEAILAGTGIDVRTEQRIERHVDAMYWELTAGPCVKRWPQIQACANVEDAARMICHYVEGAGAPNAQERRAGMAVNWHAYCDSNPAWLTDNPTQ